MPKLGDNFNNVQESTIGDGFKRMVPGVYMCRIQAVHTEWATLGGRQKAEDRECVQVLVDVDEGEFAGEYSRDFYVGKDWAHALYMSWKPTAQGILKHSFHALDEANPGFDSQAAFEADQWMQFIGRRVLVGWNGAERTNDRGYVNVNVRPSKMVCAGDAFKPMVELERGGEVKWEDYARAEERDVQRAQAAYPSDDIPF